MQNFTAKTRCRVYRSKFGPGLRRESGFFLQLSLRTVERILARVEFSSRELPDELIKRIPVLMDKDDGFIRKYCQSDRTPGVLCDFSHRSITRRIFDVINDDVEHFPFVESISSKEPEVHSDSSHE